MYIIMNWSGLAVG